MPLIHAYDDLKQCRQQRVSGEPERPGAILEDCIHAPLVCAGFPYPSRLPDPLSLTQRLNATSLKSPQIFQEGGGDAGRRRDEPEALVQAPLRHSPGRQGPLAVPHNAGRPAEGRSGAHLQGRHGQGVPQPTQELGLWLPGRVRDVAGQARRPHHGAV